MLSILKPVMSFFKPKILTVSDDKRSISMPRQTISHLTLEETNFEHNSDLFANENYLIVLRLERERVSRIPFKFEQNIVFYLEIDDDENLSIEKIRLLDEKSKNILGEVSKYNTSMSINLNADTCYILQVYHNGGDINNQVVFIKRIKTLDVKSDANETKYFSVGKDCQGCDLSMINFNNAYLRYADLSYCNLSKANFCKADLSYANLSYAKLLYTDLTFSTLINTNFSHADLWGAYLMHAMLLSDEQSSYTNFTHANLTYANAAYANLSFANFSYANLSYANLSNTNLSSANLENTTLIFADINQANVIGANLS